MQLTPGRPAGLRARLGAAACMVLAGGAAGRAQAADLPDSTAAGPAPQAAGVTPATSPSWQFETSALLYGEQSRTSVIEPIARSTRLFPSGQSLSAQLALDAMTGASPTGALPTGQVQTTTSASGNVTTIPAGAIPTSNYRDFRGGLDLEWVRPIGTLLAITTGTEFSREKDYQSLGANGKVDLGLMDRLTTLTFGGGVNHDGVFPTGGTPLGLSDGTVRLAGTQPKDVTNVLFGVSRVLTRRWLLGVSVSREWDRGYLTEPYKVISLVDAQGATTGLLTEKRPGTRYRSSVLGSSVYHLAQDVLYTSYRWYQDDWGVRSHTVDLRLRHELGGDLWVQPHLRGYTQTGASFFRFGLPNAAPLPEFASSDVRLGPLRTATLGATVGFHLPRQPGEFTVRGEYILQWGKGKAEGGGEGREGDDDVSERASGFDLIPPVNIGLVTAGYTIRF